MNWKRRETLLFGWTLAQPIKFLSTYLQGGQTMDPLSPGDRQSNTREKQALSPPWETEGAGNVVGAG